MEAPDLRRLRYLGTRITQSLSTEASLSHSPSADHAAESECCAAGKSGVGEFRAVTRNVGQGLIPGGLFSGRITCRVEDLEVNFLKT